jgi:biotin-dependent carboxylase-like uncharacterized protein|tara:strand:- start:3099 stop:4874 length:1776 start_codon:yes stop_codon:yes gene_type:complete
MKGLKVIQPGILSLIQDVGRIGQHHNGLTVGGPMDRDAFRWANQLCANPLNTPLVEITVGGLVFESTVSSYFVVTGASVPISINKTPVHGWKVHRVSVGDRVEIGFTSVGMRCYLSVPGGFSVKPIFGSCSTVGRESIGGLDGKGAQLQTGDLLPCGDTELLAPLYLPAKQQPQYLLKAPAKTVLRVVLGYQQEHFTHQQKQILFNSDYQISDLNDRMGFRLSGPPIAPSVNGILSEGICLGAIQVPADGQPIILLNDRQTIGGYPKIGSVLSLDLDKLVQLPPHSVINFEPISIEEAHNLLQLSAVNAQRIQAEVDLDALSQEIEALLVALNPRGMQTVSPAIKSGSYLRAANVIYDSIGTVLIGTGFPVNGSFETDGPVGAIALYSAIKEIGGNPIIICDEPLLSALKNDYQVHEITVNDDQAERILAQYNPSLIIAIERPGQAGDGCYYNMRGVDISENCANFDTFMVNAPCPTIAIGDGGNEIGMGNIAETLSQLDIRASKTHCDELLVADVSNWAAHGLIALLAVMTGKDLLANWNNHAVLAYLSAAGSVDGVTGENTLTEDGMDSSVSEALIERFRVLIGLNYRV